MLINYLKVYTGSALIRPPTGHNYLVVFNGLAVTLDYYMYTPYLKEIKAMK